MQDGSVTEGCSVKVLMFIQDRIYRNKKNFHESKDLKEKICEITTFKINLNLQYKQSQLPLLPMSTAGGGWN